MKKKVSDIIKTIISWIFVVIAVGMMIFTIVSVSFFDKTDRNFLGYKMFIVLSDSMKATDFEAGDLIFSKAVKDPSTLEEGDIITFQSTDPDSFGEIITHKIRKKTTDADGNPGFVTYGTTTDTDDETIVPYSMVLGQYKFRLPKVGKFFQFLKTTPGYIVCILIPFLVLIGIQALNTVRAFKAYKREQTASLEKEKEEIAQERAKNEAMMAELLAMKKQLENMSTGTNAAPASPVVPDVTIVTPEVTATATAEVKSEAVTEAAPVAEPVAENEAEAEKAPVAVPVAENEAESEKATEAVQAEEAVQEEKTAEAEEDNK